jgi:hypothetical protein
MLQDIEERQRKEEKYQIHGQKSYLIVFYFWEGEEYEEDYVFGRLRYVADGWVSLGNRWTTS